MLRVLETDMRGFETSYSRRLEDEAGMGKEEGPKAPCKSSRLMSSKWDRSLGPMMSERDEECSDDDLDDFEFVRSGGEPGAPPRPMVSSGP